MPTVALRGLVVFTDMKLTFMEKEALKIALKKVKGTDVEILLRESGLIR